MAATPLASIASTNSARVANGKSAPPLRIVLRKTEELADLRDSRQWVVAAIGWDYNCPRSTKDVGMERGHLAAIEVEQLRAGYGRTVVLDGIDLAVTAGEFVAILGSSGCGKTTLLRTIAAIQSAMAGKVRSFGRDMTDLPPEHRNVAMVFQSYALWPHMSVLGNIGYGLRLRGMAREKNRQRVAA